jgi:polar amino acid transport system ATP-binding protein
MSEPILQVKDVRKSFDGTGVLHGVSLEIREGEVVVIVGPSGCGKSTLLRCINGLETIDGGEILLRGEKISGRTKDLHLVRQKIGMVFQSYDLFPHMRVMDNLMLGPVKALGKPKEQAREEALRMLARVGLADKADVFPRTLSGGQRQRVALVRAMLMQPEILLLDEITAALDPEMVSEVLNVVLDLARDGMTMVIVTHEMRFAEAVADQVVFLEDGCVVERNPPEVFFHQPETERARRFLQSFEYAPRRHAALQTDTNTAEMQSTP